MRLEGYEVKKLLLFKFLIKQVRAEGPMEHIAQGKRSDTLGSHDEMYDALKGQKH